MVGSMLRLMKFPALWLALGVLPGFAGLSEAALGAAVSLNHQLKQPGRCIGPVITCALQFDKDSCEGEFTAWLAEQCLWVENLNPNPVSVSFFNQCDRPVKVQVAAGSMGIPAWDGLKATRHFPQGFTEAPTPPMVVMPGQDTGPLFATDLDMVYFHAETADGQDPVRTWPSDSVFDMISPSVNVTKGFRGRLLTPGRGNQFVVTLPCDGPVAPFHHLAVASSRNIEWGVGLGEDAGQAYSAAMGFCTRGNPNADCIAAETSDGFNQAGVAVAVGDDGVPCVVAEDSIGLAARAAMLCCESSSTNCRVTFTASNERR